jgi:hypothetical protein
MCICVDRYIYELLIYGFKIFLHICVYSCMNTCIHNCLYVYMYVEAAAITHALAGRCVCVNFFISGRCVYICTCINMYVYMYMSKYR